MAWTRFLQGDASGWAEQAVDLLFPPHCPICRRESSCRLGRAAPGPHVCEACARTLSADVSRCLRCGAAVETSRTCCACRRSDGGWDRIAVLSAYGGELRDAVLRAKRPSGADVAAVLAGLLVRKHGDSMRSWAADCVVPVPMHWWRRSLRGTSVADELASALAGMLCLPWSRGLVRHRSTRMQNELPIEQRPHNVHGAFRARRTVRGARILLVDDVMTTGATLRACCRSLRDAGARGVDVAVVARADLHGSFHDAE